MQFAIFDTDLPEARRYVTVIAILNIALNIQMKFIIIFISSPL